MWQFLYTVYFSLGTLYMYVLESKGKQFNIAQPYKVIPRQALKTVC